MGPARVGFLVYLLLWTAVLIPCVASGSGIRAVEDSWLLGSLPSGLAVWEVAMSQGKLFSFPELPQQSFSFQVAPQLWNRRVQLAGRWDSLGKGLFKDEKWRGELMVGSRLGLGVCLKGKRQQIESRMGQIQLDPLLVLQVRSGGQGSSFWLVKMDIPPQNLLVISGIGQAGKTPHFLNCNMFHGLHGRALPVAQGVKIKRPDLNVFVIMGDGDCCSIGTAHWIHALRYNMNMTAIVLDNSIYGLTKNQASPTSPLGLISNTTPKGTRMEPINPIDVTLGVGNASFVAQTVDWIPDLTHDIIQAGFPEITICNIFYFRIFVDGMDDPSFCEAFCEADGRVAGVSTYFKDFSWS